MRRVKIPVIPEEAEVNITVVPEEIEDNSISKFNI